MKMKNKLKIAVPLLILSISFILFSFTNDTTKNYTEITSVSIETLDIPENIKAILDTKCMGCHSDETKPGKSKSKMNFDKLTNGEYSTGKVISKLDKITKMLSKDKMPPQKFLDKYPDKKLTDEESKLLSDWASQTSSMMKGE